MRCGDCSKFVSHEARSEWESDPEYQDGSVVGTLRLVLACSECGSDLAEVREDVEVGVEIPEGMEDVEPEIDFESEPEVQEEMVGAYKDGKPYPVRYQKHVYWVDTNVTVEFEGKPPITVNVVTPKTQSSHFDQV